MYRPKGTREGKIFNHGVVPKARHKIGKKKTIIFQGEKKGVAKKEEAFSGSQALKKGTEGPRERRSNMEKK